MNDQSKQVFDPWGLISLLIDGDERPIPVVRGDLIGTPCNELGCLEFNPETIEQ